MHRTQPVIPGAARVTGQAGVGLRFDGRSGTLRVADDEPLEQRLGRVLRPGSMTCFTHRYGWI